MEFEFDEIGEETGEDECPSCGVIPSIDGHTPGCHDPNGCGADVRDFDEEEPFEADNEEDEVSELDFG